MPKSKKVQEYQKEYIRANYDRIDLFAPKGWKPKLKEIAKESGKSLNSFVLGIIQGNVEGL